MEVTLSLWIDNQPTNHDCTDAYIVAAGWAAPAGVTLDLDTLTLAGSDPDVLWLAYRSLMSAVAAVGHGDGCESLPDPRLTACPVQIPRPREMSAEESWCRHLSLECETWEEYDRVAVAGEQK